MVRDFTEVTPRPKSEVRRRIEVYRKLAEEEILREIERRMEDESHRDIVQDYAKQFGLDLLSTNK